MLTEALTFPGIKAAAAKLRVHLVSVAMDGEGLDPDALKAACKRHRPKAVYLIPTLHNPTTITLDPERRKAVANIIRHTGTILIEDDAYGLLEPSASPMQIWSPNSAISPLACEKYRAGTPCFLSPGA